jgi:uncharacterized protein (UPF0332 family)
MEFKEEASLRVFQQFMDIFIKPEIRRRQEKGQLPTTFELQAAQIVFFPDGRGTQVRLNSEVRAIAKAKLKPGITKKAGEPIYESEVEGLREINLFQEDDADCGHATLIRIADSWIIAFDFRYNKALSQKHMDTASEFYESAEFSFNRGNMRAFIDNLFSATELTARSVLLVLPDPKFRKNASHAFIQMRYNSFAKLGNVNSAYCKVFNKLSGLRDRARYLRDSFWISKTEARNLLDTVKKMMQDALRWIQTGGF